MKCIYIDPPYNTGSDGFTYQDNFGFTVESLVEKIGLGREEAERTLALQGKSSHSAWLTFMLPRLSVAQRLLKEDGAIFISIGDDEYANLKLLCDSIFGEQNFVSNLPWQSRKSISDDREFSQNHTHTLVYSKDREQLKIWGDELNEHEYTNPDNDPRGPWKLSPLDANKPGGDTMYAVKNPVTGEDHWPSKGRSWAINSQTMAELIEDNRVAFGKKGVTRPQRKLFYFERVAKGDTKTPSTFLLDAGTTAEGTAEVEALIGPDVFTHPKPVGLVKKLVEYCTRGAKDAIVLDFFSGSATTADAVMQLNAEDGVEGQRKFIMVQLSEKVKPGGPAAEAGFATIDEIGRKRIQEAGSKIKSLAQKDIDTGFKLFRIEPAAAPALEQLENFDPSENTLFSNDMVAVFDSSYAGGYETILTTWLNKDGYGLLPNKREVLLHGYNLDICGDTAYVIKEGLSSADVVELVRQLENAELKLARLVYYPYSVDFGVTQELNNNLQNLRSGASVRRIARY
uniref:site-specific DNA-methyltransferase n=1 Tax=Arthrobacter sp. TaxID=1667 RepID=UPI00159EF23B|nr:DNA methyltransferase [Arthrobacter sp.]